MLTLVSTVVRAMRMRQSEHKLREHTFSRSDSKLFDMHPSKSPILSFGRLKRVKERGARLRREGSKQRNAVTSKSAKLAVLALRLGRVFSEIALHTQSLRFISSIPNAKPQ